MNISEIAGSISSVIRSLVGLGLSLVLLALVIDIFAPGTMNIVSNLAGLINSFVGQGLVGLAALIVVVAIADNS